MSSFRIIIGTALCLFSLALTAQEFGERISLTNSYQEDLYTAAGTLISTAAIEGDLVAAGGDLIIDGHITGDALLFGGEQTITADITDDLRAIGGTIIVNSKIGGDAILGGGQIMLSNTSTVGGKAWIGGGEVTIAARINRELRVGGGKINLSGHIGGNALIWGENITIDDGAVIEGDLNYHSPNEATIHPNAQINGTVTYTHVEFESHGGAPSLFALITLAITATIFYLLFPAFSDRSSRTIGDEFWKSLGVGVIALLVIPFISIIMMSIVIGVWIALLLIALYLMGLLLGSLIGMLFVGNKLAQLSGWDPAPKAKRIITLFIAYGIVGVVQFIPVIGALITCSIVVIGMGAGLLMGYRLYITSGKVTS